MTRIRVHANADEGAAGRIEEALLGAGVPFFGVTIEPGQLVGDEVVVDVDDAVTLEQESDVRRIILEGLEAVTPSVDPVVAALDLIERLSAELATLKASLAPAGPPAAAEPSAEAPEPVPEPVPDAPDPVEP